MLITSQTPIGFVKAKRASNLAHASTVLPAMSFFLAGKTHQRRAALEQFVASIYEREYGAQISHFHETLVGGLGSDGQLQAVLGITPLATQSAFLEQYLDQPIEQYINYSSGKSARVAIAELGNLSAQVPGASRAMIRHMTRYLYLHGYRHVVFTATQSLANSFSKLHYDPLVLAKADPTRLSGDSRAWGTYYDSNPQVMVGDVRAAYAALF